MIVDENLGPFQFKPVLDFIVMGSFLCEKSDYVKIFTAHKLGKFLREINIQNLSRS